MSKNKHESQKRIAFPIQIFKEGASAFAEAPEDIHVVPVGKWDHPFYGEFEITTEDIQEFVKNFKDGVRKDLPITAGHDNGMSGGELPAIGWFKELYDRGVKGLYAFVEWTEEGKKLVREGAFKYFSPELYTDYEDPETREKYRNVLVGGALTNKPYFKELEPVAAFSEPTIINQFNLNDSTFMDINTILAKKADELSAEEKAFLKEHKDDLNDEQKESFKSVLEESDGSGDGSGDGAGDGSGDGAGDGNGDGSDDGAGAGDDAQKNASEKGKKIMMSEVEVAALRSQADKGARAFAELETMKLDKQVSKMVFSDSNKDGRFLPKQKDSIVSFMKTLSEKQRDQFANIIGGMPKADTKMFSELGESNNAEKNVQKEIENKVSEARKADNKLSYSEALRKVLKENPELEKGYSAGE